MVLLRLRRLWLASQPRAFGGVQDAESAWCTAIGVTATSANAAGDVWLATRRVVSAVPHESRFCGLTSFGVQGWLQRERRGLRGAQRELSPLHTK